MPGDQPGRVDGRGGLAADQCPDARMRGGARDDHVTEPLYQRRGARVLRRGARDHGEDTGVPGVQPVDPLAGEAKRGRQQGHRRGHHQEHGDDRAERRTVDERQAEQEQAEQREHDGRAGEHDGPAR
jgi:hypothetical protein